MTAYSKVTQLTHDKTEIRAWGVGRLTQAPPPHPPTHTLSHLEACLPYFGLTSVLASF